MAELNAVQGKPAELGGYFMPNNTLVEKIMRPSDCFNNIISA